MGQCTKKYFQNEFSTTEPPRNDFYILAADSRNSYIIFVTNHGKKTWYFKQHNATLLASTAALYLVPCTTFVLCEHHLKLSAHLQLLNQQSILLQLVGGQISIELLESPLFPAYSRLCSRQASSGNNVKSKETLLEQIILFSSTRKFQLNNDMGETGCSYVYRIHSLH